MKKIIWILISVGLLNNCFAQTSDSLYTFRNDSTPRLRFSYRQLTIPVGLSVLGVISNGNGQEGFKKELMEERDEHLGRFHTKVDNYLQFSPIVVAYGLDLAGIKSKTDFTNRSAILFKGEVIMLATVFSLKSLTREPRPDGSSNNSFPSGHTAQAFAAATFLNEEYKDRFHWMPYAAYGLASGVGMLRIANNRHYVSDVLMGAGLGILSMKVAYWTHHYHWGKREK